MRRCSLVLIGVVFATAGVAAQDFSPPVFIGPWDLGTSLSADIVTSNLINETLSENMDQNAPSSSVTRAEQSAKSLTYQSKRGRRDSNLRQFAAKSRQMDPRGAAAMERLFASTDIIDAIDGKMRTVGLRADNVADAYALWWMLAWHATRGTEAELTRATALAVRDQAARAILATPEFANADDAAKQQMAEALLVQAMLVDGMNEKYGSDPAMQAKLARAVIEGAGKVGLDLTAMELTPAGFVPRRGADAKDAAGDDAQPTALAAATRPDDSGIASAALPLAIGAVALGGVLLLGREWGRRG